MIKIIAVCIFAGFLSFINVDLNRGRPGQWPQVLPLEKEYEFGEAKMAQVDIGILGADKKVLYTLHCQSFKARPQSDFEYSGEFECRLTQLYGGKNWGTLFLEDPNATRTWESRGRFLSEELIGKCGDYPDYGRRRTFRLRGMTITLEVVNPTVELRREPGDQRDGLWLKSFRFRVKVEPDQTVTSEIAEPSAYVRPPYLKPPESDDNTLDCGRVIKRKFTF